MAKKYPINRIARIWSEDASLSEYTLYERLCRYCRRMGFEKPYRLERAEALNVLDKVKWIARPSSLESVHCKHCGKQVDGLVPLCAICKADEILPPV